MANRLSRKRVCLSGSGGLEVPAPDAQLYAARIQFSLQRLTHGKVYKGLVSPRRKTKKQKPTPPFLKSSSAQVCLSIYTMRRLDRIVTTPILVTIRR